MSYTDHSEASSSYEKESPLLQHIASIGTHKVKYQPGDDWDLHLDIAYKSIDVTLVLPHYRARNQPIDHRMNMFIGNESAPVRVKVCRNFPRSKFYLEIQGATSDVTVWLPSDFKGQIHHSGKATFSAGFVNRIMQNVRFSNSTDYDEVLNEDEVVVCTRGRISFRMWNVQTCSPENTQKEALKRMFGCARKLPETSIDWDFLLED